MASCRPTSPACCPRASCAGGWEATRHHPDDRDDFGVLAAAGEDLPGALIVRPADIDALPETVRTVGVTGGADNLEIAVVEGATEGAASVSGVQNKLALSTAHAGRRYTMPTHGRLSDLIAKLPARNDDSQIFNEYVSMQLAQAAGVAVAPCKPQPLATIDVPGLAEALGADLHFLAVDRFDREPGGRVHAEDGCQVLTRMPSRKYAGNDAYVAIDPAAGAAQRARHRGRAAVLHAAGREHADRQQRRPSQELLLYPERDPARAVAGL